jgi:hypothetical protein
MLTTELESTAGLRTRVNETRGLSKDWTASLATAVSANAIREEFAPPAAATFGILEEDDEGTEPINSTFSQQSLQD